MLKSVRLQKTFNAAAIVGELSMVSTNFWLLHYNKPMYEGGWNILPLRSIGGSMDNIISIHESAGSQNDYADTELLRQLPYTGTILEFFECEKTAVRFMKLDAGAVIKEHRDHDLNFEKGEARLHIPVITHPAVEFLLDNQKILMQEGECWYLNLSQKHSVKNLSPIDRIHLVIDVKVNDWLVELFQQHAAATTFMEAPEAGVYPKEQQRMIIAQLRIQNTATALALAEKMERELA